LAIILYVFLQFTASNYAFGILNFFFTTSIITY